MLSAVTQIQDFVHVYRVQIPAWATCTILAAIALAIIAVIFLILRKRR